MRILPLALGLGVVAAASLALTSCGWNPFHKMYSATAEIQIRPMGVTNVSGPIDPNANLPDVQTQFATEIAIMQSNDLLLPIIQDLKLDQIWAKRFKSEHDALPPLEALDHLRKVLKMEVLGGTNLINITAYSELPQEAADIANAVADHYKAMRDNEETSRTQRGVDALKEQIAEEQKVVEDQKAVVEKIRQNLGGIILTTGPSQVDDPRAELIPFQDAQHRLEQQKSILDALNVRLKQVIADEQIVESPVRIISRAVAPPE